MDGPKVYVRKYFFIGTHLGVVILVGVPSGPAKHHDFTPHANHTKMLHCTANYQIDFFYVTVLRKP